MTTHEIRPTLRNTSINYVTEQKQLFPSKVKDEQQQQRSPAINK